MALFPGEHRCLHRTCGAATVAIAAAALQLLAHSSAVVMVLVGVAALKHCCCAFYRCAAGLQQRSWAGRIARQKRFGTLPTALGTCAPT